MLKWITDYLKYIDTHPNDFNKDVKNNARQIKELLSRPSIEYKEADPIAFEKLARMFKHREGIWAGQPIVLNMEQKYIAACVLGIKEYSKTYNCFVRYFNETNIFVTRKWGKDTFSVPLICFLVGFDHEPNAWCQIVAENEKQAKRTYNIIKNEVNKHPLSAVFVERKTEKYIECKINNGKIEYLSGRTKGKDGGNPSVAVANEVHEITNYTQYTSLKTGMGARKQPMMICISSAGITPESLYEFLQDRNRKFLGKAKLAKSDHIFALMYGIDETDDYKDDKCWVKANPAMYEGRPTMKFLREQYEAMKDDPAMLSTFLSKHLGRQVGGAVEYFDLLSIKRAMKVIDKQDFFDCYAVGGVDLAETTDLCNATAMILKQDGTFVIIQAYFIAAEVLERNSKHDKQDYVNMQNLATGNQITSELVIVTPGSYVQKEYVTNWFVRLRDEFAVTFLKIGYDRALSKEWLTNMNENGFSHEIFKINREEQTEERDFGVLTQVAQGGWSLSEPIKIIKTLFDTDRIKFDSKNKLLPYCFYNLKVKIDTNNNFAPAKNKSNGHIDGTIGIFNAFVAYQRVKELYRQEVSIVEYLKI